MRGRNSCSGNRAARVARLGRGHVGDEPRADPGHGGDETRDLLDVARPERQVQGDPDRVGDSGQVGDVRDGCAVTVHRRQALDDDPRVGEHLAKARQVGPGRHRVDDAPVRQVGQVGVDGGTEGLHDEHVTAERAQGRG